MEGVGDDDELFGDIFDVESNSDTDEADEDELSRQLKASGFATGVLPEEYERPLLVGCTFPSWEDFDKALHEYEAVSSQCLTRLTRNKERFDGKCHGWKKNEEDSCEMFLNARLMKKIGLVTVRSDCFVHTCPTIFHEKRSGQNRKKWLKQKLMRHVRIQQGQALKTLQKVVVEFNNVTPHVLAVSRARKSCKEEMTGGTAESYSKLPAFCNLVRATDENATACWQADDQRRFLRIFIAPGASKHVYPLCAPLVGLDGTHSKSDFPGIILLATCYDGEKEIVILAWAVVPVEDGENWEWFLAMLDGYFPTMRRSDCVFMSDRDKGLKKGVRITFLAGHHSCCTQHLAMNVRAESGEQGAILFRKLVNARTETEFKQIKASYKPTNARQAAAIPYINSIPPEQYARYCFPVPRYGNTTSNVVECLNSAIQPARELVVLFLCESLWIYTMDKHYARSLQAKDLASGPLNLTVHANNEFRQNIKQSRGILLHQSNAMTALVIDKGTHYTLDISADYCQCGDWKEMGYPCIHVIRFASANNIDVRTFFSDVWKASTYKEAYSVPVPPLSIHELPMSDLCLAPVVDTKQIRPKNTKGKRRRSRAERAAHAHKVLEAAERNKCGTCGKPGHNKRSCPDRAQDPARVPNPVPRPSMMQQPARSVVRVGARTSMTHTYSTTTWADEHTRSSTQTFTEWIEEADLRAGHRQGPQSS